MRRSHRVKESTLSTQETSPTFSKIDENDPIQALAFAIAEAAADLKALAIRIIDVRGIVSYADYVVVCHGTSITHTRAIADAIRQDLRSVKVRPRHIEGNTYNEWVLLDFFDVIVHVFVEDARQEYAIEALFSDAPRLPFDGGVEPEELDEQRFVLPEEDDLND